MYDIEHMQRWRKAGGSGRRLLDLARGPGSLMTALRVDRRHDGVNLFEPGQLWIGCGGHTVGGVGVSVRIGITKVAEQKLRYLIAGSKYCGISRLALLTTAWCAWGLALTLCNKVQAASACPTHTTRALQVSGSTVCLLIDDSTPAKIQQLEQAWIERSAQIVAAYYGRFPAPVVVIKLRSSGGAGVNGGRTTNDEGLMIQASVGRETTADALGDDWVMVHEMVHLALPEIGRSHDWLAEGLAVYVEGIARAQAGNRAVSDVWAEDRRDMPKGLPRAGEGGMDETRTWARTYWGGALFCLQADLAIREQTHNKVGLQTALRAILKDTGGYGFDHDIVEVLRIGDAATGTHVLYDLYNRSRATAQAPDLDLMWTLLGVPENPSAQPFDDRAPLAAVRTAITAPP